MGEVNSNSKRVEECRKQAAEIVSQMTLEEKVHQTLNWAPAVERLGIPAYNYWNEGLHGVARAGVATVFPQAITMAAAFDPEMMEEVGDAIATEGRAKYNSQQKYGDTDIYKGLTFWSPNVNIFRDPRWGRGHETYGEDPYLTSRLAVGFINGLQGHDENFLKSAACAKHFAVHSGPEDIRHSFDAEVSTQDLYETYLPAFETCVKEADVEAVMGAYNRTNGEPCCGSPTLLQKILREDWGFKGHVTSDCWAIKDFYEGHKVVDTPVEAVAMAMNNGCDLNCGNLFVYLEDAVKEGLVKEERLDEALINLYATRIKLGILGEKKTTPWDDIPFDAADSPKYRELNKKVIRESEVLLKNNGILPLDKNKIKTIGIVGPNADSRRALVGNYEGTSSRYVTILEGIEDYVGDDVRVLYSEGCHLYKDKSSDLGLKGDRLSEVRGVCDNSDVVIAVLGLDAGYEGEEGDKGNQYGSGDKPDLNLPGLQNEVLKIAVESGKPVILVLLAGSALSIGYAEEHCDAVLFAGYAGAQGGAVTAEILFGDSCPEGKLPITFYQTTEELPPFTDYAMKGRTYRYMTKKALYPFGYGLSYTDFTLSDVKASAQELGDEGIDVTATVKNIGSYDSAETLQVYVKIPGEDTPNAQLKGFKRVRLAAGEEKAVTIHLDPSAFGLYGEDGVKRIADGCAKVFVGTTQPDERSKELTGKESVELSINTRSLTLPEK